MRVTALFIVIVTQVFCQPAPDPLLLYRDHQWFAFRDAVRGLSKDFERGVVACTFNDVEGCERYMHRVIASTAGKDKKTAARMHLTALYSILGRSRLALSSYQDVAKTMGESPLLKAFAAQPEMSVARLEESTLPYARDAGKLAVPVTINGTAGNYILDTGAGFSAVSESEARRVGMRIVDIGAVPVAGFTGATAPVAKIGIADKLELGRIELRNVPFLVLLAENLMPAREGALGVQVLIACGAIYWNTNGFVRLGRRTSGDLNTDRSNLSFDGDAIYAQAALGGRKLNFHLDTGGGSYLSPLFAKEFPALVRDSGQPNTWSLRGFGESNKNFPATMLPEIQLDLAEGCCTMHPAPIIEVPGAWGHGMIGFNLLKNARAVTLDFRRMIWTVE